MTEEQARGLVGLGSKLISNLPSQFILLCLVNLIFIGSIVWLIDRAAEYRERLIAPIVAACLHPNQP